MTDREPVAWELRAGKTDRVLIEITNNPARAHDWKAGLNEVVPLYAAPRHWVGLTDEEVKHMLELFVIPPQHIEMVVQAIEAKLKEKNT
jgi:hypothetical protein